jgi:hypothetical protein
LWQYGNSPELDALGPQLKYPEACFLASVCFAARPVIFDTDMDNDIDDRLA